MLLGIPKIISPELLKVLCEMGHGDRLVIADANFPSERVGKNAKVIRMDGIGACDVLRAVLKLFPLDHATDKPATLMTVSAGDDVETPIWAEYETIIKEEQGRSNAVCDIERFAFYKEASEAYAIIATGEGALYANIMLQKGVVK